MTEITAKIGTIRGWMLTEQDMGMIENESTGMQSFTTPDLSGVGEVGATTQEGLAVEEVHPIEEMGAEMENIAALVVEVDMEDRVEGIVDSDWGLGLTKMPPSSFAIRLYIIVSNGMFLATGLSRVCHDVHKHKDAKWSYAKAFPLLDCVTNAYNNEITTKISIMCISSAKVIHRSRNKHLVHHTKTLLSLTIPQRI